MVESRLNQSILETIKKTVSYNVDSSSDNDPLVAELITYIDGALGILNQNGIGNGNRLGTNESLIWNDFLVNDQSSVLGLVIQFVSLKTRLLFDPPLPATITYMQQAADESLWRIRQYYEEEDAVEQ